LTSDWRKEIPLIQGEQVLIDLDKIYGNDERANFLCEFCYPQTQGGPLLITNYRVIHMQRTLEPQQQSRGIFGKKVTVMVDSGYSFHAGIPLSHIDRFVLDTMTRIDDPSTAGLYIHILPAFWQKHRSLFSFPAQPAFPASTEGVAEFGIYGSPDEIGKEPTPQSLAKRIVDEGNKILAGYMTGILTPCKYCGTKLKQDMAACSFCGAPIR